MFFKPKKLIGLDIGTSTIKMAEVETRGKSATLTGFAMAATPPNSVSAGDVIDTESLAEAVRYLANGLKTKRSGICTALWGTSVIIKRISVPRMDEKLLEDQIRWEAEQYIPFDINEVNLEYKVLENVSDNPEAMELLLIAARQESVLRYAEIVMNAGFECEILDVGGFALANCFELNYGVLKKQVVALLNVGASVTNLVIVESGEVVFCRDIPVGGVTYSMELQKSLGISPDEAEVMKLSISRGEPAPDEAAGVLNVTHEMIAEEIQGSIDFFLNTTSSSEIAQCYLTGGCIKVAGLVEFLQKQIKIPCEIFDPFFNVNYNKNAFSPSYISEIKDYASIALGLGLRKIGD